MEVTMEKYGFVYIWYDRKHKRYYVGCHWGTIDDGYICSSSWMKQGYKHRPFDFKRRILKTNVSREALLEEEYKWLSQIKKEELGKRYYNVHNRHFKHWSTDENKTLSIKEKLSIKAKELHKDPEYRKKMLEGCKNRPKPTQEKMNKLHQSNIGKKRSKETKRKIGMARKGKILGPLTEETKRKIRSKLTGKQNPFYGKKHSDEKMKQIELNISKALKGKTPKNIELLNKSYWWNNGTINKRTIECPGTGWVRGQLR